LAHRPSGFAPISRIKGSGTPHKDFTGPDQYNANPMAPPFCKVWFVCNFVVVRSMLHDEKHSTAVALTVREERTK
jgi:hypothetical protein